MTAAQGPSSIPGDIFPIAVSPSKRESENSEAKHIHTHIDHAASASVYEVLIEAH